MKAQIGAFNQEEALVGAFSVIVKTDFETDGSFSALLQTPRPGLVARPPGGSRVPPVAVSTSTQQQRCSSEPDNMNIVKVCHTYSIVLSVLLISLHTVLGVGAMQCNVVSPYNF